MQQLTPLSLDELFFFASVNDTNFLNDITGNSRWWTIPVQSINHQHGLDMQQVFAQIKENCYDKGEQWWLTNEEEAQLTVLNKDAEVISCHFSPYRVQSGFGI